MKNLRIHRNSVETPYANHRKTDRNIRETIHPEWSTGRPGGQHIQLSIGLALLYYCITVLLYYCITVLLYHCITVLCITVLLHYCTNVLLYYYYCGPQVARAANTFKWASVWHRFGIGWASVWHRWWHYCQTNAHLNVIWIQYLCKSWLLLINDD